MTWFDLSLILLIAASVAGGVRDGFSRSGLGLVAVVAAFLAAAWLCPGSYVAFLIVFVALIGGSAAAMFCWRRTLQAALPKWADSTIGGVFGAVNAVLLATLALLAVLAYAPRFPRETIERSQSAPYLLEASSAASAMLPAELKDRASQAYAGFRQTLPPNLRRSAPAPEI